MDNHNKIMTTLEEFTDMLSDYVTIESDITEICAIAPMTELEALSVIVNQCIQWGYTWAQSVDVIKSMIHMGMVWNSDTKIWTDPNYPEAP